MLCVFFLLGIILLSVNVVNYTKLGKEADAITLVLAENKGTFPSSQQNPSFADPGTMNPETPYDTRYFTVTYTDGEVSKINTDKVASIDQNTALAYAEKVKNKSTGWLKEYRYRVYTLSSDSKMVIFIDYSRQFAPTKVVMYSSAIVFAVGLGISFVIVFFVSKKMVKPLEDSNRKQKRFISDASHELKTPITIISANSEILEMEHGENECTQAINKQVTRLSMMVKDLNSLARLDENEKVPMAKFDFTSAFLDVCDSFKPLFESENKKLDFKAAPDIRYNGNEKLLRKLLSIILDNARKYSSSYASISLAKSGNRIIIKEANDGEGIKDGSLNRVFERFYRSDEVRGGQIEGSGIGLSIGMDIVNLHHGKINAYGEKGIFNIKAEL